MLRVIATKRGGTHWLELHGTLGGEWVPLLEEQWRAVAAAGEPAQVLVVLANVDFIAPEGEWLLQRMAAEGVEFAVSGCLNRSVIDRVRSRARRAKGVRG
jgi:hypothetical protein